MECFMKKIFVLISLFIVSCNTPFIPTIEHPTPDLWCAQWNVYGEDVLVCAKTPLELNLKLNALKAKQMAAVK